MAETCGGNRVARIYSGGLMVVKEAVLVYQLQLGRNCRGRGGKGLGWVKNYHSQAQPKSQLSLAEVAVL